MLIDQAFRRGVAFVMMEMPKKGGGVQLRPAGTAFFVSYKLAADMWLVYAVTAKHVIDEGLRLGATGMFLRVVHGHEFRDIAMTDGQWMRHPETDIAVARVVAPSEINLYPYPIESLMFSDASHASMVGEGDDVFFVGLFNRFYGNESMLPIVRFGNIALMPYEPISVRFSGAPDAKPVPIEAYLVEARSWGGHSGSPAWVYFPMTRDPTNGVKWEDMGGKPPMLLGVVVGHYPIDPDEENFIGDSADTRSLAANAGIAIVVPSVRIMEALLVPAMKDERDELLAEHKGEQPTPMLDTALGD